MDKLVQCLIVIFLFLFSAYACADPTVLRVVEKNLTVNGQKSKVFDIVQANGTVGYMGKQGQLFDVTVQNKTQVPLVLHWHGIIDPNEQDGVPYVTQLPIPAGGSYHYQFKLKQAGTYWLHSHYKLQEQRLMAAPLIIHEPHAYLDKEVVMFVQDFTFRDPREIYAQLRSNLQSKANMKRMNDVRDVKFDAYLTNRRTLQKPYVMRVAPLQMVLLRIINASASSNYFVDLGSLEGSLVAVDGQPIKPIQGSRFQMAIGNRLDIKIKMPAGQGAYPILALPEGTRQQTGLVLATTQAKLPKLSESTTRFNPSLTYQQELNTSALTPLPAHRVQRSLVFDLQGEMRGYRWTINGQEWPYIKPFIVKPHERVEMVFNNKSSMAHPMHFHGHEFQITEINGKKIAGRRGDTINVLPHTTVKVVFDTDNPGIWMLHCHILYHQKGGMMTTINYANYPDKFTLQQRVEGEKLYEESGM